eukprot:scaffold225587_cov41-Attheya_sp.AAC.1
MERHFLSEPRISSPEDGGGESRLEWEVDVHREGVSEVIETLTINDTTLPPRTNKRGKVLWRLPTDHSRLPTFGADEKRRIMEFFKEVKKSRKKNLKKIKSAGVPTSSCGSSMTESSTGDPHDVPASVPVVTPATANNNKAAKKVIKKTTDKHGLKTTEPSKLNAPNKVPETEKGVKGNKLKETKEGKQKGQKSLKVTHKISTTNKSNGHVVNGDAVPKSMSTATLPSPMAPPGFSQHNVAVLEKEYVKPVTDVPNRWSRLHDNVDQNASFQKQPEPVVVGEKRKEKETLGLIPMVQGTKCLQVRNGEETVAVRAAKAFCDVYYPMIQQGSQEELALYYTPRAQKSVSVGGAHSVVCGFVDIFRQLSGLANKSLWKINGVVAQDTYDGKGAHLLITGTLVVVTERTTSTFCHSVSLAPVCYPGQQDGDEENTAFQIHNDAMALLGGGTEMSSAPSLSPPQNQQMAPTLAPAVAMQSQPIDAQQFSPPPPPHNNSLFPSDDNWNHSAPFDNNAFYQTTTTAAPSTSPSWHDQQRPPGLRPPGLFG